MLFGSQQLHCVNGVKIWGYAQKIQYNNSKKKEEEGFGGILTLHQTLVSV
jgi:hypothetical protein